MTSDVENNNEMTWWDRNKKKVYIGAAIFAGAVVVGVGVGAVVKYCGVPKVPVDRLVCNTRHSVPTDNIESISSYQDISSVVQKMRKPMNGGDPFPVSGGIRNLPEGWHASDEQIDLAQKLGIYLEEGQTYVRDYVKNAKT